MKQDVFTDEQIEEIARCVDVILKRKRKWRWKVLTAWIVLFSIVFGIWLLRVENQSASLKGLQETNCSLRTFLLTAANVRQKSANDARFENPDRKIDQRAADGYRELAGNFSAVGKCHPPEPLEPVIREEEKLEKDTA